LCFALGYELHENIHFDLRYYLGVKDVVKSNASSFQFNENQNKSGVFILFMLMTTILQDIN